MFLFFFHKAMSKKNKSPKNVLVLTDLLPLYTDFFLCFICHNLILCARNAEAALTDFLMQSPWMYTARDLVTRRRYLRQSHSLFVGVLLSPSRIVEMHRLNQGPKFMHHAAIFYSFCACVEGVCGLVWFVFNSFDLQFEEVDWNRSNADFYFFFLWGV